MGQKSKRKISYRSCDVFGQPVPFLPIQGKFLSAMGFNIGTEVDIQYDGGGFIHISRIIKERYLDPPEAGALVPARR